MEWATNPPHTHTHTHAHIHTYAHATHTQLTHRPAHTQTNTDTQTHRLTGTHTHTDTTHARTHTHAPKEVLKTATQLSEARGNDAQMKSLQIGGTVTEFKEIRNCWLDACFSQRSYMTL